MTTPRRFYQSLSRDYAAKIRQLVPAYDDMVDWLVELVAWSDPAHALDIGCGDAYLTTRLLERLPGLRATGVEASAEMAAVAREAASRCPGRLEVVQEDILDFEPAGPLDAACSNLVLHNLPEAQKRMLLKRLAGWIRPGGVFVWGDLVRQPDPELEERLVAYRIAFAREHGCPEPLVEENFAKEGSEDHPLTVDGMMAALCAAGFHASPVWARDTFAIVRARRPPS